MLVHKFGGSSVADAKRLQHAAQLASKEPRPAVVVTSALGGVTDRLIELGSLAQQRRTADLERELTALHTRHLEAADTLVPNDPDRETLRADITAEFSELGQLLQGVQLLEELSPRSLDLIASFGERLAARLLAAALNAAGTPSDYVDARSFLRTDDRFGAANVDFDPSRALARESLLPQTASSVPVVTGFIGATADGRTTTLGRGGSDYTATLVGAFLDADEIWVWTDVDGVMTADPRVVPEARALEAVSFREAAEMAYFGSKILHPSTMIPAIRANIPVRIRSSMNPELPGTLVSDRRTDRFDGVKTVTSIAEMALVTIEGRGMIGVPGIVGRVFTATARAEVNVYMISQASSEQNITFLVREPDSERVTATLHEEFDNELRRGKIDRIDTRTPVGILAIIGEGMKGTPGISRRLFAALGASRINVLAIAQGSSELNVSVVVDQQDLHRAVGAVHTRFGLTSDTHVFLLGKGLIGRTLLQQLLASRERLHRDHGLSLKVVGVAGRSEWLFDPHGLSDETLTGIAAGASLLELGGEARPTNEKIVAALSETRRLDVVLCDVTAAETGDLHHAALTAGIHVVGANKKPLSGSLADYEAIRAEAARQGLGYHFETTFGAGLPVLFTLQELLATHDRVRRITGCFSGTLGYICTGLQEGRPLSEMVVEAKEKGFTEPDPRDDLSGLDVARKALIIAREIGMKIEMDELELASFVPAEFMDLPDVETFLARLPELDEAFARRVQEAENDDKVLRYVAEITPEKVTVGLRPVPRESATGQLFGPDNVLVYETERYAENHLVIRGPGAGAQVTAAGVFGDILKIARHV
ncbi:MAG: bifunctional aspartate kinase/homoserine dehydrogenase I [Candidatus Lernaella stagnicola]|nr:bifunctional aspartate kinase/homoserine dehydrogenase I [Candidatus Lernaella stagnicola]